MSDYGLMLAPDTVRIERLLPGPIERVWAYLVEPEQRRQWLAAGPMVLQAGGAVDLLFHNNQITTPDDRPPEQFAGFGEEQHLAGRILACEPLKLLAFTWGDSGESSQVCFELSAQGQQVRLVVTHSRLRSRTEMLNVSGGWHTHLDLLSDVLNQRQPLRFWATFTSRRAEYDKRIPADHQTGRQP